MDETKITPPPVTGEEPATGDQTESPVTLLEYETNDQGVTTTKATTTDGRQISFDAELPGDLNAHTIGRDILKPIATGLSQATGEEQEPAGKPVSLEWDMQVTAYDKATEEFILTSKGDKIVTHNGQAVKLTVRIPKKYFNGVDDTDELQAILTKWGLAQETPEIDDLFKKTFAPMLTGEIVDAFMQINTGNAHIDKVTKKAVIQTRNGVITINHFENIYKALSTSAKKILNTAIIYLTNTNYYTADNPNPSVEIPLIQYGKACGYQLTPRIMETAEEQAKENKTVQSRIINLKKSIRRDLQDIKKAEWTGSVSTGRNKGDYANMGIISSHRIINGKIIINFDIDAARYLTRAYVMQHPTALLKVDNRNPNTYAIGFKIAQQNSNDNNATKGTNNTLSVKSLLAAAPEIPTIEDLTTRGQRNWKDKIKKPLDNSLQELTTAGVLTRWEYRDPTTGKTYTAKTAQPLTWPQYSRLMVDFILAAAPDQTERREAKAKAKAAEAEAEQAKAKKKNTRKKKD